MGGLSVSCVEPPLDDEEDVDDDDDEDDDGCLVRGPSRAE